MTETPAIPEDTPMQVVTFNAAAGSVTEILLPMRLVAYNGGSRRLLILSGTLPLPEPVVSWLVGSSQYGWLITNVAPFSSAGSETVLLPAIATPPAESEVYEL
jgi:hypothetical protein